MLKARELNRAGGADVLGDGLASSAGVGVLDAVGGVRAVVQLGVEQALSTVQALIPQIGVVSLLGYAFTRNLQVNR